MIPRPWLRLPLIIATLAGGVLGLEGTAQAKGTFFLLELNTGIGESAYTQGAPGLSYGASGGVTFRIPATPLRWHLLGTVAHRSATVAGINAGTPFVVDRRDIDLYAANRIVLPVWRMIRVYGELGLGTRFTSSHLRRGEGLGSLTEGQQRFLMVTALGAQARVSKHLSLGLRGELTPVGSGIDLATFAADLSPTRNRASLLAQIGVHF